MWQNQPTDDRDATAARVRLPMDADGRISPSREIPVPICISCRVEDFLNVSLHMHGLCWLVCVGGEGETRQDPKKRKTTAK